MTRRPIDDGPSMSPARAVVVVALAVVAVVGVGSWLSGRVDDRRLDVPGEVSVTSAEPTHAPSLPPTVAVVCSDMSQHHIPAPTEQVTPGDVVDFHGAPCIVAQPEPSPSPSRSVLP